MNSVLLGALFLAIWNSVLFYGKSLGISVILFIFPLLGLALYELHIHGKIKNRFGLLFIIPILLLSLTYFLFNSLFFRIFNLIVISLLFILLYLYTIKPSFNIWVMLSDVFSIVFEPIDCIVDVFEDIEGKVCKALKFGDGVSKFFKSFIVVVPVVGLVLLLLASADMVFGSMFETVLNFIESMADVEVAQEVLGRLILIILVFVYLSASIYFLVRKYSYVQYDTENLNVKANCYTIKLLLTVLNIVYVLFDIIQIRSLMLHQVSMDISYAEYARQGFFQLMFVSVINLGIILFAKITVREGDARDIHYIKLASTLMVLLTLVIIGSSFFRMYMYESEYGYTLLRLLVYVALFTESVLLVPTVIYIFNSNFNILKYYMVICIVVYTFLNYVNVDFIIARRNVERFYEVEKIDLDYLKNDGTDNIEVLVLLYNKTDNIAVHNSLVDYFRNLEIKMDGFQEYNLSKAKAIKLIDGLELAYFDDGDDDVLRYDDMMFEFR